MPYITNNYSIQEDYEITDKIGRGKYADVYSGVNMLTGEEVAIKVFKPIKKNKVRREVKILKLLKDGPNIMQLHDVVRDPATKTPAIVTEYVDQGDLDLKKRFKSFTQEDIQYYMLQALKALDYAHSQGVMHRDVKPHNLLVNWEQKTVTLADWGLAEFYVPETEYNTRVAALFYKAPELLLGYPFYDYSVDIWALGCVFAELLFQKQPFFAGKDAYDQMVKVAKVLGTKKLNEYIEKYKINVDSGLKEMVGKHTEKQWDNFKNNKNEHLYSDEALDLLSSMLKYDHTQRITAKDAMNHAYFNSVRG